jgi:hydroxypyruvate isomerase
VSGAESPRWEEKSCPVSPPTFRCCSPEQPFLERFKAAAEAGFGAVEFMFPYEFSSRDIVAALKDNGLGLVLHNLPAGDWARGERGIACQPDRVAEFRDGVSKAVEYAQALNCPKLNCLSGILPSGVTAEKARGVLVENLQYAAGKLEAAKIGLLLEPVNNHDIPGFFSSIVRASRSPSLLRSEQRTSSCSTTSTMRR